MLSAARYMSKQQVIETQSVFDLSAIFIEFICPTKFTPMTSKLVPPIQLNSDGFPNIIGIQKGIQGHYNSCYLDSTIMSMFAFNSSFDYLLQSFSGQLTDVLKALTEVVNTLRRDGLTTVDIVTSLRKKLEEVEHDTGLMEEEKDPEEFLNLLLHKCMKAKPLLELTSGETSFIYQIFVEENKVIQLPTVQHLLEQSLHSNNIKLTKVPDNLLLIMPRFGNRFKSFDRIFTPAELDVSEIVENARRYCFCCGESDVTFECFDCFKEITAMQHRLFASCEKCNILIHKHPDRKHHKYTGVKGQRSNGNRDRLVMELYAVICIETSHYVSYIKCENGLKNSPWCFFDSMADRQGDDIDGVNIPEVVKLEDDFDSWLSDSGYESLIEKADNAPRQVKRLLKDVYMCMYRNPKLKEN